MNFNRTRVLLLSTLLVANSTIAAPSHVNNQRDLTDIYQLAVKNDQEYVMARETFLAEREGSAIASSALLPQLNGGLSSKSTRQGLENIALNRFRTNSFNLSLSQSLISVHDWLSFSAARAKTRAAYADFLGKEQQLILRVAGAYFKVLLAQDQLALVETELHANQKRFEEAEQRFQVGLDAETAVFEARANFDLVRAERIAASTQLQNSFEELRVLTGKAIHHLAPLARPVEVIRPEPMTITPWEHSAVSHNYAVIAAEFGTRAARRGHQAIQAEHLPSLRLNSDYSIVEKYPIPAATQPTLHSRSLELQLAIPIFSGARVTAESRKAAHQFQKSVAARQLAERQARSQAHLHFNNILAGISKLGADRQAIRSSQSSLDSVMAAYKVGTRTIVDVLVVERSLYQAKHQYVRDQYQFLLDALSLKLAAGVLSSKDVWAINALLRH